jgi:hypothetical protein
MEAGGGVPGTGSRRQLLQIAPRASLGVVPLGETQQTTSGERIGLFGDDTDPLREAFIKLLPHHAPRGNHGLESSNPRSWSQEASASPCNSPQPS